MPEFVVDAGPLIHLHQIGRADLLGKFASLLIPTGVFRELKQPHTRDEIRRLSRAQVLRVTPEMMSIPALKGLRLQRGETECLALALTRPPCIVLTDDLAARRAAKRLSLEVHGSIGLIVYAAKRRWLTLREAEEALKLLDEQSTLFVTYAIIEDAIRTIRQMR